MALMHLFVGGVAELDEGVVQLGAGLLRERGRLVELVGAEDLLAEEDVGEIAARLAMTPPRSTSAGRAGGEDRQRARRQVRARRRPKGSSVGPNAR